MCKGVISYYSTIHWCDTQGELRLRYAHDLRYNKPGTLVPNATNVMDVTLSKRPTVQPK